MKNKGIKNLIFGLLAQFVTISLGIIIPRLTLVNLGSESNGLLNSINNILTYMSLLEAGVGTATLQALYKPFSLDDKKSINRIMAATNYFYKRTGTIYLLIVIAMSIGYTAFIKTSISKLSVFFVVLLSGLSGAISYFFQGKFKIFLRAEGKSFIETNITTFTTIGVSIAKIIILNCYANVVLIQSTYFFFNLIQMLIIVFYMRKNYKWLDLKIEPDFEAISQRKSVLVHQISELVFNNIDVLLLTFFSSLMHVSVYTMYAMIFGMVKSVTVSVSDSFLYSLGQKFDTDRKTFLKYFDIYEVYNMSFTFAMFCIAYILILPFLKLYTADVNDIDYIDKYIPILFVTFYLMANGRKSSNIVINFAQHFEKTQWRAVLETIINLLVSIFFTVKIGIYGVLIGTIVALLYRTNDMIIYSSKLINRTPLITYKRWITNVITFVGIVLIVNKIDLWVDNYYHMIITGIILCICIIPLFLMINSIFEPKVAKNAIGLSISIIKEKFKN